MNPNTYLENHQIITNDMIANHKPEQVLNAYDKFLSNCSDKDLICKRCVIALNDNASIICNLLFYKNTNARTFLSITYNFVQHVQGFIYKDSCYYLKNKVIKIYNNYLQIAEEKRINVNIEYRDNNEDEVFAHIIINN